GPDALEVVDGHAAVVQVAHHPVESLGELADLVVAAQGHGDLEVAGADALGGLGEGVEAARDAAADDGADGDRDRGQHGDEGEVHPDVDLGDVVGRVVEAGVDVGDLA